MDTLDHVALLGNQATWYAWGQQDAGVGTDQDALAFGSHFRKLAEGGARPSIQDAWKAYVARDDVPTVAVEAPVVTTGRTEDWGPRLFTWIDALEANYQATGHGNGITFECDAPRRGQKYVRLMMLRDGKRSSVHAFYDIRTGEVYKPATLKAPAKHVRFDLADDASFARMIEVCDWAGSYLYLR